MTSPSTVDPLPEAHSLSRRLWMADIDGGPEPVGMAPPADPGQPQQYDGTMSEGTPQ